MGGRAARKATGLKCAQVSRPSHRVERKPGCAPHVSDKPAPRPCEQRPEARPRLLPNAGIAGGANSLGTPYLKYWCRSESSGVAPERDLITDATDGLVFGEFP